MQKRAKERFSIPKICCLCGGMIGFHLAYVVVFGLVDPIMTKMKLSDFAKTIAWFLGPLIGFLFQPIIGYYSDRSHSKYGRRTPYIVFGSLSTCIGFLALFLLDKYYTKLSIGMNTFLLLTTFSLILISMNCYQGPSRAIIGDVLPEEQQNTGYSLGTAFIGIASIITSLIGGIGYFVDDTWLSNHTTNILLILGLSVVLITMLMTVLSAKEEQFNGEMEKTNVFRTIFNACFHMPKPIARVSLCLFFSQAGFFPFSTKMTTFISTEVFPESESGKGLCFGMFIFAVMYTVVMLYGFIHVKITEWIGLKATYGISMLLMSVSFICSFFTLNKWVLLGIFAPVGISFHVMNSVPFTIVGIVAEEKDMCVYMSVMNNFMIFGQIVANILNAIIGAITNSIPNCSDHLKQNQILIGCGSLSALIAAISSYWIITPKQPEIQSVDTQPLISNPGD